MCKKRKTICVVDDEPSVCKAMKRLLMSAGYNVITYSSGQEFLNDSLVRKRDLLILDVQMPAMTGLDVQKQLIASDHAIPILFISANGTAKTKIMAMTSGAVAFFQKPVDEKDLLSAIHQSIGNDKKEM